VVLAGLVVTTAVSLLPRLTSTPRGVEDSWQRNAAEVAHELDVVVARHKPELVLIAGDPQAISALLEHAGGDLSARIVQLDTGGRAKGTPAEAQGDRRGLPADRPSRFAHVRRRRRRVSAGAHLHRGWERVRFRVRRCRPMVDPAAALQKADNRTLAFITDRQ